MVLAPVGKNVNAKEKKVVNAIIKWTPRAVIVLFYLAIFFYFATISYAISPVEPYTSDQTGTYANMTIEDDGFKFTVTSATASYGELFSFDNSIPNFDGTEDYTLWYTGSKDSTCSYPLFVRFQWLSQSLDSDQSLPDSAVTSSSSVKSIILSGSNPGTGAKFYHECTIGDYVTIHKLQIGDDVIFDHMPTEGEATSTTETILLPPTVDVSFLATTTCSGSPTSSVCTYEYSTSTATSTEALYLSYILDEYSKFDINDHLLLILIFLISTVGTGYLVYKFL